LNNEISRSQAVYDYILNNILTLEFAPGSRIPEEMIASQMGTSRTPIREALRRLATEGLIALYPNRYAKVIEFTEKDIYDLGIMRIYLDIVACRLAILNGSNADYFRLSTIAKKCDAAAKNLEMRNQITLDNEFHLELANITGNNILKKIQSELSLKVCLLQAIRFEGVEKRVFYHHKMVEAIMDRDIAKASKGVIDHLSAFYNINVENRDMDYFDFTHVFNTEMGGFDDK